MADRKGVTLCGRSLAWGVLLVWSCELPAGDWPQILGPARTGIATGERLADSWPDAGPAVLWHRDVGAGLAGVAVSGEFGILFHRQQNREVVEAFDPQTGARRWREDYPTSFIPGVGTEDGPLCVPTIDGDRVITFGAQGVLTCWDLRTGARQWQRMTHTDFDAPEGYFGAGSAPLVFGDRVIVNVGGHKQNAGIVGFSLQDGRVLWQQTNERASYAAPIATSVADRPVIVVAARLSCVGLDPADGRRLFELSFGRTGPTVNAATPLVLDDRLFLTASYGIGAVAAKLDARGAHELWRKPGLLASQYTTPIAHDGLLYGIDGRDDGPPADLVCLDPATGELRWRERQFGYATLLMADGKLLLTTTDGRLLLARPNPGRFERLAEFRLTSQTVRALPALANGRLLVRDTERLYCLSVGLPTVAR